MNVNKKNRRSILFWFCVITFVFALATIILSGYFYFRYQTLFFNLKSESKNNTEIIHSRVILPIYCKLDTFTLNLIPNDQSVGRVFYVGITLRLKDIQSKERALRYLPEIRSRLLILFSQQNPRDLTTIESKKILAEKIRKEINDNVEDNQYINVSDVLFNTFIIR